MNDERDKQLEKLLDSALANYGAAEPLRGLEERVLGRLEGERSRRPWWMWAGVAVAAMAVLVIALLMRPSPDKKPAVEGQQQPPQTAAPEQSVAQKSATVPAPGPKQRVDAAVPKHAAPPTRMAAGARPAPPANAATPRNIGAPPVVVEAMSVLPKRDVFPTPMPPTEQEILLARHVRETPPDVVLAEANRKLLDFHEDPLTAPASGTATSPQKAEGTR